MNIQELIDWLEARKLIEEEAIRSAPFTGLGATITVVSANSHHRLCDEILKLLRAEEKNHGG